MADGAAATVGCIDPTISRRRAEALKPFIDRALALQQNGLLSDRCRDDQTVIAGVFTVQEWWELVEAFKPEAVSVEG